MKSGRSPNRTGPVRNRPVGNNQGRYEHKPVLAGLVIVLIISVISALALANDIFQPQITAIMQQPAPTATSMPTPQCVRPTLSLGAYIYPVDRVAITEEGTLPTLGGPAGTAFLLSGTTNPLIFIFIPAIHSLGFQDVLVPGDQMIIQWADCSREEFVYTDFNPGSPDTKSILGQTTPGILVIIQPVGTTESYILHGQRPELTSSPAPNPTADDGKKLDINLGKTVLSDDKQSLLTNLMVTNRGTQVIRISSGDLTLTAQGIAPLDPMSVLPALPQEIQPGAGVNLVIVFTNPGGNSAVLRVLDKSIELQY